MWKYGSATIHEGKSWVDDNGITHPSNWQIWSDSDKAAAGVTEIVLDATPDSRLYTWTHAINGSITTTAIALATVKANFTTSIKSQQESLLYKTDWAVVRRAEKTTAIPSNIATWRDAIRAKATAMEDAIDGAANTAAVQVLIDNGSLTDWPVLGD
jgi:hypothetical protein|tara:strand:- start:62 stop:529 length:468 start_codon:yes stop_codon:yes gene_type:complete